MSMNSGRIRFLLIYLWGGVCMCAQVCEDRRLTSAIFLDLSPLYILRQGLLPSLQLATCTYTDTDIDT